MRTSVKFMVIYRYKDKYSISEMCRFFNVSRSGYYIRFYDLVGKDVVYSTTESNKFGTFRGKIKYVIQDSEIKK